MSEESGEVSLQIQLDDALGLVEELAALRDVIERGDYSERDGVVALSEDDWGAIFEASDKATKFLKDKEET